MGGSPQREGAELVLHRRAVVYARGLLPWLLAFLLLSLLLYQETDSLLALPLLKLPLGWFGLRGDDLLALLM